MIGYIFMFTGKWAYNCGWLLSGGGGVGGGRGGRGLVSNRLQYQAVGVVNRNGKTNQSQCLFSNAVIGLYLSLLLATPKIWFSID